MTLFLKVFFFFLFVFCYKDCMLPECTDLFCFVLILSFPGAVKTLIMANAMQGQQFDVVGYEKLTFSK